LRHQIPVVPVPGRRPLLAALSLPDCRMRNFFCGIFAASAAASGAGFSGYGLKDRTIIFYAGTHRIAECAKMRGKFWGDRRLVWRGK